MITADAIERTSRWLPARSTLTERVYPGLAHGISDQEIADVRTLGMLKVTAVDARTGELMVFDSAGDAGLVDAVGASCAVPGVWPPVTIGDRRLMDGGVRSIANADLAAGYERVVIVAPVAQGIGPMTSPRRQAAAGPRPERKRLRSGQSGRPMTDRPPSASTVSAFGNRCSGAAARARS